MARSATQGLAGHGSDGAGTTASARRIAAGSWRPRGRQPGSCRRFVDRAGYLVRPRIQARRRSTSQRADP
jgi:hypothetical protein